MGAATRDFIGHVRRRCGTGARHRRRLKAKLVLPAALVL